MKRIDSTRLPKKNDGYHHIEENLEDQERHGQEEYTAMRTRDLRDRRP